MDTRIYVCTHKRFNAPEDPLYHPLHVGRAISGGLGYEGDDTGDNISQKNKSYCELTGMYWVWKNVTCDVVGIAHYRRYLERDGELLDQAYIEKLIYEDGYDVIIPACSFSEYKDHWTHYAKTHYLRDYEITREVILEKYPEYAEAFDLYGYTNISTFANMVITKKEIYDEYCEWLFDVLDEVEKRTDVSDYIPFQARLYGYLSERLFQIWLLMHKYKVREEQVKFATEEVHHGRLVLFVGVQDTLDIFTTEFYKSFTSMGYECLLFNTRTIPQGLATLSEFLQKPVKAAIGFNNLGFNMEIIPGQNIWDQLGIPFVNILVDHPFCYDQALSDAPGTAIVLTIDKNHMNYINRFYPRIATTGFLPLAGRTECMVPKDIKDRSIDVIYLGGTSRPFIEQVRPDYAKYDFDARAIGDEAYEMMLRDSSMTTEDAIEKTLLAHDIRMSDEELKTFLYEMRYVDMMIVTHYREAVLESIARAGINVSVYGVGWDGCDWIDLPNVDFHRRIPASETYALMEEAKIVLSTMTWFKDGAHDRIYSGMLCGACVVSDTSQYMKENYKYYPDGSAEDAELAMFELYETDRLPEMIQKLLSDNDMMQTIADNGRRRAMITETWSARANELHKDLLMQL